MVENDIECMMDIGGLTIPMRGDVLEKERTETKETRVYVSARVYECNRCRPLFSLPISLVRPFCMCCIYVSTSAEPAHLLNAARHQRSKEEGGDQHNRGQQLEERRGDGGSRWKEEEGERKRERMMDGRVSADTEHAPDQVT